MEFVGNYAPYGGLSPQIHEMLVIPIKRNASYCRAHFVILESAEDTEELFEKVRLDLFLFALAFLLARFYIWAVIEIGGIGTPADLFLSNEVVRSARELEISD